MNAAVKKSLELDDTLSDAHTFLAEIKLYNWDWSAAEREYKRAIELDPSNSDSHVTYAEFLNAMERFQEAIDEYSIAQRLDPLNPMMKLLPGWVLLKAGEYDRALEVCRQVNAMEANIWITHELMGLALFRKGQRTEGIAEMEVAVRLDPGLRQLARLGRMYGYVGRKDDAQRVLKQSK